MPWGQFCLCSLDVFYSLKITWHDDVIKWKHFPCHWPFVRGIHLSPVNSPHKSQWRGALMFSLISPEQTVEYTIETPAIWEAIVPIMTSLLWIKCSISFFYSSVVGFSHVQIYIYIYIYIYICQHIETETTWPTFCTPHFEMHGFVCSLFYFDSNFT